MGEQLASVRICNAAKAKVPVLISMIELQIAELGMVPLASSSYICPRPPQPKTAWQVDCSSAKQASQT